MVAQGLVNRRPGFVSHLASNNISVVGQGSFGFSFTGREKERFREI